MIQRLTKLHRTWAASLARKIQILNNHLQNSNFWTNAGIRPSYALCPDNLSQVYQSWKISLIWLFFRNIFVLKVVCPESLTVGVPYLVWHVYITCGTDQRAQIYTGQEPAGHECQWYLQPLTPNLYYGHLICCPICWALYSDIRDSLTTVLPAHGRLSCWQHG